MKRMTAEEFVERSRSKFGDKFSYNLPTYINARTEMEMECPIHGKFLFSPIQHYKTKYGCPKCGKEVANNFLSSTNRKRNLLSTEQFIQKAKEKHGNRYDYSKTVYQGNTIPVTIICKQHGEFKQRPDKHTDVKPCNCPKCSDTERKKKLKGVYSFQYFRLNKDKQLLPATLYVVKATTPTETFHKVGITITSINKRFKSGYQCYEFDIILQHETTLFDAFCKEQEILEKFKEHQYVPLNVFGGHNECLVLSDDDINEITQTLSLTNIHPTRYIQTKSKEQTNS